MKQVSVLVAVHLASYLAVSQSLFRFNAHLIMVDHFIKYPDFHLVLAGYQPAWAMWYIALIPQALVLCLIYTQACGPRACAYISGKALEPVIQV